MNNKEWLEWRRKGIGASDAPVIMGVSPYKTPYQLWEEKVFGTSQEETAAMKRGKDLEGQAILHFESELGIIFEQQYIKTHPTISWMLATLDGYHEETRTALEVKWPNKDDHLCAIAGNVPEKYYPQCQHQMKVNELEWMYYGSCHKEEKILIKVHRDQPYIDNMIEKELEFYNSVINLTAPKYTDKDYVDRSNEKNFSEIEEKLYNILKRIGPDLEEAEELKEELKIFCEGKSSKGKYLKVMKTIVKGAVDYKAIPELKGIDTEKYRKPPFPKYTIKVD